jgi:hypothetical protein
MQDVNIILKRDETSRETCSHLPAEWNREVLSPCRITDRRKQPEHKSEGENGSRHPQRYQRVRTTSVRGYCKGGRVNKRRRAYFI